MNVAHLKALKTALIAARSSSEELAKHFEQNPDEPVTPDDIAALFEGIATSFAATTHLINNLLDDEPEQDEDGDEFGGFEMRIGENGIEVREIPRAEIEQTLREVGLL